MSKFMSNRTAVCNVICAVLLALLIGLQFTPFWHFGENESESVSINGYVWMPTHHPEVETYLQEALGNKDFTVTNIVAMPAVTLLAGAVGIFFCLWKSDSALSAILPAGVGITGIWGYLSQAAFKMGECWQAHLAVCIVITLVAVFSLVRAARKIAVNRQKP